MTVRARQGISNGMLGRPRARSTSAGGGGAKSVGVSDTAENKSPGPQAASPARVLPKRRREPLLPGQGYSVATTRVLTGDGRSRTGAHLGRPGGLQLTLPPFLAWFLPGELRRFALGRDRDGQEDEEVGEQQGALPGDETEIAEGGEDVEEGKRSEGAQEMLGRGAPAPHASGKR